MTDKEIWTQLVQCPGWLLLKNKARTYWAENIDQHLAAAANDRDDVVALNRMRQVIAAKQAVEAMLALPDEEIRKCETLDAKADQRVGNLAEAFSRRGGL